MGRITDFLLYSFYRSRCHKDSGNLANLPRYLSITNSPRISSKRSTIHALPFRFGYFHMNTSPALMSIHKYRKRNAAVTL
jgi:hypothetical protein